MPSAVIFCRHGETGGTLRGWLAGAREVPPTGRGRAQARKAAACGVLRRPNEDDDGTSIAVHRRPSSPAGNDVRCR
ncbi:histidine phosphatase family protein [Azospirillum picis]|uniref:Broad specificity phosphatase PhoE n=1 Tax=Azospirillum picis TaxID=488438 RepID=A0ABU0MT69_9PROT|nr:histidine phosphatase family protein [Azospirillum picis]MBP2302927.1 broad specificity phosphatase PhoE [Azospirillum picis]MDQ0536679.1 broad specificity phosphatase PhoE [Azospirillum picis]